MSIEERKAGRKCYARVAMNSLVVLLVPVEAFVFLMGLLHLKASATRAIKRMHQVGVRLSPCWNEMSWPMAHQ
jgi:hypothetical protein